MDRRGHSVLHGVRPTNAWAHLRPPIASHFTPHASGLNLHRDELMRIVRAGINFSFERTPTQLSFLAWGLGHFTHKLPQEDCQVGRECLRVCINIKENCCNAAPVAHHSWLLTPTHPLTASQALSSEVDNAIVDLPEHDPDDEAWKPLYQYLAAIKVRGAEAWCFDVAGGGSGI